MGANRGFWIAELSRIFQRSSDAINSDRVDAAGDLEQDFNSMLDNIKRQYPDDELIQSTDSVDRSESEYRTIQRMSRDLLHNVRNRSERLALRLDVEVEEPQSNSDDQSIEDTTVFNIENNQEVSQSTDTEVNVESTIRLIESGPWNQDITQELRDIFEEFQSEMDNEDPNQSRLRQLIQRAGEHSTDVAAKMGVMALKSALVGVLGL